MAKVINNYRGFYYFLSNFYPCKFTYGGETWRSAEHCFQAQKTVSPNMLASILHAKTAVEARVLGHSVSMLPPTWEDDKSSIMKSILMAKFEQNPNLARRLVKTKDKILAELTINDPYWNMTPKGGKNVLGKLLMEVRDDLKQRIVV